MSVHKKNWIYANEDDIFVYRRFIDIERITENVQRERGTTVYNSNIGQPLDIDIHIATYICTNTRPTKRMSIIVIK